MLYRKLAGPLLGAALGAALGCGTGRESAREDAPAAGVGTTGAPRKPSAAAGGPATLPAQAARKLLVTDVAKDPYRPRLPAHLDQAGATYSGRYRICVNPSGQVDAVKVVSSTGDSALDEEWMQVIRTWRYMPLAVNNRRRPFCYVSRLEVTGG